MSFHNNSLFYNYPCAPQPPNERYGAYSVVAWNADREKLRRLYEDAKLDALESELDDGAGGSMTNAVLYCKKRVYSHSLSKTAGSCGLLIASIDPCPMDGGAPALVSALVRVRTIGGRPGHAIVKYGAFNAAIEDKVAIELSTTGAPSVGQREFDEKTAAALRMSLDDVQANMARQDDVRIIDPAAATVTGYQEPPSCRSS